MHNRLPWHTFLYIQFNVNCKGHGGAVVAHMSPTSEVDGSNPGPYVGKMVVSYRRSAVYGTKTLTNCMYWFPLPLILPVMIRPIQC